MRCSWHWRTVTVGALARWEAQDKRAIKLATGGIMIALGAVILIWIWFV